MTPVTAPAQRGGRVRRAADHHPDSKLPKITAGDQLSMTMNVGYATSSLILVSAFLISLAAQLVSRRYRPVRYWTVILTTSTAGTTMSDCMDRSLGLGYAKGAGLLIAILFSVFAVWRATTGSLSVEHTMSSTHVIPSGRGFLIDVVYGTMTTSS
jgi:uncharacterized membrane-anchored protein